MRSRYEVRYKTTGVEASPQPIRAAVDQKLLAAHPALLHIHLALSTKERHGYGIMKQVEAESHGKVSMGPGTLYGSIGRMIEAGLITQSKKKIAPEMDDERGVYYKLTAPGRIALSVELERYYEVIEVARSKTLIPRTVHE